MNKKLFFSPNTIQIIYYRYKELFTSVGLILISIIVFVQLVVPQLQQLFSSKSEEERERQKVEVLRQKFDFLINLDPLKLDSDAKLVSTFLPTEKDFSGIIAAVSNSAASSGVKVSDFSFQVGELSSTSKKVLNESTPIVISVDGSLARVKNFLQRLSTHSPVSEVESVELSGHSYVISLQFYYKSPVSPSPEDTIVLKPLSLQDIKVVDLLATWSIQRSQSPLSQFAQTSSKSANINDVTSSETVNP